MLEFARLQLRMAPERIHFLKFILEGYDHLGMQSTIDARQGLVELRFPAVLGAEVEALVEQLIPSLGVAPPLDSV